MANNLFISYDLIAPGQHYHQVTEAIKSLGAWAKIEYSLFYVKTPLNASQAANQVWASMTPNDKLIVLNTTLNEFSGYNIEPEVLQQMQRNWYL